MPTGIYFRTEYHRKINSIVHLGIKPTKETRIKMSISAKLAGAGKWLKGKKLSEETKRKIGLASKGRPSWLKGKKLSEEQKIKMKMYGWGGSKNPRWKGGVSLITLGITANKVYRQYHPSVVCEKCNSSRKMVIHHKDKNRQNNDISNLHALCNSCHSSLHHKNIPWTEARRKAQINRRLLCQEKV